MDSETIRMNRCNVLIIEAEHTGPIPEDLLLSLNFSNVKKILFSEVHTAFETVGYDIILFHCENLNEQQLQWLLPLSRKSQHSQFLILSHQISIHAYRNVATMNNLITIQMPSTNQLIQKVLNEFLSGTILNDQTKFPRFITDEPVRMIVMETGLLIPTRMRNYSMGGAYLEYKGISLRVGHTLKVNLMNQENISAKKVLQLDARVVWVKQEPGRKGRACGIGIQFLENERAA